MMKNLKFVIIFLVVIYFITSLAYQKAIVKPVDVSGNDVIFIVNKGESVKEIGKNLAKNSLINSEYYFNKYIKKSDNQLNLQAGEYVLNPMLNIKEIVEIFVKGNTKNEEDVIKVIEGWSVKDIAEYFEKLGKLKTDDFFAVVGTPKIDYRKEKKLSPPKDFSDQYDFLSDKPDYYGLEGYLFPDTYRIFKNASIEDVVYKMLNNFNKKFTPEMRAEVKKQGKTIFEIVTMASVVEKEVRSAEDMKLVSGIFWNRINNKQPLQSCASLAYVLGVNKAIYSTEDTQIESLYNTYQHTGLPPAPIANPGLNAIMAAIYPAKTDYFYFLTSNIDGKTIFAKTYEEHLKNKTRYLK